MEEVGDVKPTILQI